MVKNETVQDQNAENVLAAPEAAVEAILFAAGHPVPYEKLSDVIGISVRDIKNLL